VIKEFDPILLEVMWNRLISIVNEQAAALIRASFTTITRETEDLSCGIFTPDADMIVQALTGTPGHINCMATAIKHFVKKYPKDKVKYGDVLICNDPWLCSGHRNDFTSATPIFKDGVLVGWTATTCHSIDIGGAGWTADTRDVLEEGIGIPIMKIFDRGEQNHDLFEILKANSRMPKELIGDIMAQVSSQDICAEKVCGFMEQYQLNSLEPLAEALFDRSERAMRAAIEAIPDGKYHAVVFLDGFDDPLKIEATITINGTDLTVDYTGTSPQLDRGINVPLTYIHAQTTYTIKFAISPDVPNNEGSFRPVKVTAPEGCVLNAQFPHAVVGRHLTGHFGVAACLGALEKVAPEKTIGDGGGVYVPQWFGRSNEGKVFINNYFFNGGMGARYNKDGIHAFSFPPNVKNSPIEVVESISPLFFEKKEILPNTGGIGKYRGGCGQSIAVRVTSPYPALINGLYERTKYPALGRKGGGSGALAQFIVRDKNGEERRPHPKSRHILEPGDCVILNLAGGGGYGLAHQRNPEAVLQDVIQGFVSVESAIKNYKVAIHKQDGKSDLGIDWDETKKLRNG
jgi:N-methylhydantoinase B